MSLTANPLVNAPSSMGDISSMQLFQDFGPSVVASTTRSYANSGNYIAKSLTGGSAAITTALANAGVGDSGFTAIVVSTNDQEIFATKDPVPAAGALPSATTRFTKIWFGGNCQNSVGSLVEG